MNSNEEKFASLLTAKGIEFEAQHDIIEHFVIKAKVDFYTPKYNLYCELISNRQTLYKRIHKLRNLIVKGYKFTFYNTVGYKLYFTDKTLMRLGITSNRELPIIPELEDEEINSRRKFYSCKVYS